MNTLYGARPNFTFRGFYGQHIQPHQAGLDMTFEKYEHIEYSVKDSDQDHDELVSIEWDSGRDPIPRNFGFVGRLLDKYFPVYSEQKRPGGFIATYKSGKTITARLHGCEDIQWTMRTKR